MAEFTFHDFIDHAGWGDADITLMGSDWSPRRYWRLTRGDETALLMHSVVPDFRGHRLDDFVRFNAIYRDGGINVPRIFAQDMAAGLLLLEDFGLLTIETPVYEQAGYETAVDALFTLQRLPTDTLTRFEDGYIFQKIWLYSDAPEWKAAWNAVWAALPPCPHVFSHMDYKAGNLHWLPERTGLMRLGVLDYQTAQNAPFIYDLVNLLEDARRNVPDDLKKHLKARFKAGLPDDWQAMFDDWYAVMAAQFHLMIAGQMRTNGKGDTDMMMRLEQYLDHELKHPALAPVARLVA